MYKELVNLIERQYDQEIMKGLNRLPPKKGIQIIIEMYMKRCSVSLIIGLVQLLICV